MMAEDLKAVKFDILSWLHFQNKNIMRSVLSKFHEVWTKNQFL